MWLQERIYSWEQRSEVNPFLIQFALCFALRMVISIADCSGSELILNLQHATCESKWALEIWELHIQSEGFGQMFW